MTERLLQYIWQHQYFNRRDLRITGAARETCLVLSPGTHNTNQGPDFLGGRIRIGRQVWVGNIELHLKASEWFVHGHQHDSNYNNVVLHVVWKNDIGTEAHKPPMLELEHRIPHLLLKQYEEWMMGDNAIPCSRSIGAVNELVWSKWKETLVVERLQAKTKKVQQLLSESKNHWEETFWWLLARNFGVTVNRDAFEQVARSISLNIISRHRENLFQLEALLFGQANLLATRFTDDYANLIRKEYQHLRKKYKLEAVHTPVHFLRMRPGNFPTIRLAQLASLLTETEHLFPKILNTRDLPALRLLFDRTAGDYWHYHFRFDEPSPYQPKNLGKQMVDSIIINTVVPMVFAYGHYHSDDMIRDKALYWLDLLEAEKNRITTRFYGFGVRSVNAFDTQALYHLKTNYCDHKRCLECAVGNSILRTGA